MATRQTRQKKQILQVITQKDKALSADQILNLAKKDLPTLALTTVYRNLDQLVAQGTISRLIYPDGITRYQIISANHGHELICLGCGETIDVNQCPISSLTRQIEDDTGFDIVSHQMTLYGYCQSCKRRN